MNKKIVYIGFAYKHHKGTHAGYQHIKEFMGYDHLIECQKEFEFLFFDVKYASLAKRSIRRLYAKMLGDGCPFAMFRALLYSWMHTEDVSFHIIYGDNIYAKFFYRLKRKKHQVIATVHQPFDNYMRNEKLKNKLLWPDKLIILSNNELKQFNDFTGKNNVGYIPHGICTDFYKPAKNGIHRENSVLLVGNWLRDFDLAEKVFKKLRQVNPEIQIDMVGSKGNEQRFGKLVNYHYGISDEELLALYQSCSIVYLPLLRFTANNALLEAASTGCRLVVATDNAEDNTYLPMKYVVMANRNVDDNIHTIGTCVHSNETSTNVREFIVKNYSWEVIAEKVRQFIKVK